MRSLEQYAKKILPKITPEHSPRGYRLVDHSDSIMRALLFFGVAIGFGGFFMAGFVPEMIDGEIEIGAMIVMAVIGLVVLGLSAAAFKQLLVAMALKPGELFLNQWPLRAGQPFRLRFERRSKGSQQIHRVKGRVILEEHVSWREGTTTRTAEKIVWAAPLDEKQCNGHAQCDYEFTIPKSMPLSFHSSNNELRYKIQFYSFYGKKKDDSEFTVLVAGKAA